MGKPEDCWGYPLQLEGGLHRPKKEEYGMRDLFACFGLFGRLGVRFSSMMSFFLYRGRKTSLVFLLWTEAKKFIQHGPSSIAGFIDWVGCK